MPLPAALAAKLSKRGLITGKKPVEALKKVDFKGLSTCPNKYNVYHECNSFCETWKGFMSPEPRYVRNMHKLLGKYPLPNNWTEVFDKGVGRYYYWNMETDLVSWLPPRHPLSIKTQSAAKLREKRHQTRDDHRDKDNRDKDEDYDDEDNYKSSKHSDRRDRDRDKDRDRDREDRRHRRDDRYRKKSRKDDIDPMDPAAYSDIPQGTWSDGLETNKRNADSTATGVLFQQRPYPAPGEVLALNKEKSKKK